MPVYFLDTSALVKRYVAETGSETVTEIVSDRNASIEPLIGLAGAIAWPAT